MKKILLSISGAISFLLFLVLLLVTDHMGNALPEQQMAERWSEKKDVAQVSCFFSPNASMSEASIEQFEHELDAALVEASVTQESENPSARLWADAYSADGRITVTSDHGTLDADAIGIGGDFFLFHPLKLLTGAYFSGNDLMQDYCLIDEDAAWQLFGSNDVAGQIVTIGGIPHIVTGVVERATGRMAEAAGLDSTVVYVSYETLSQYGQNNGINHYEIVMPNPVKDFALTEVQEQFGGNEREVEILENTSRYSLLSRLKNVGAFGTRSMNGKAIIYPYWENMARGYEDIISGLTCLMLIALFYPVAILLICFIYWWKHKGWTLKDVWNRLNDRRERLAEELREKRKKAKRAKKAKKENQNPDMQEESEPDPNKEKHKKRYKKFGKRKQDSGQEDLDAPEPDGEDMEWL